MTRVENEKEGHFLKEGQNNITHYCLFLSYVFVFLCINQDKFIFKNFKKYITHLTIFLEHVFLRHAKINVVCFIQYEFLQDKITL
jgi:hypothetical protein